MGGEDPGCCVQDPLAVDANEDGAIELLLSDRDVSLSDVVALLA